MISPTTANKYADKPQPDSAQDIMFSLVDSILANRFLGIFAFLFFVSGPVLIFARIFFENFFAQERLIGIIKFIVIAIPTILNIGKINLIYIIGCALSVAIILLHMMFGLNQDGINDMFLTGEMLVTVAVSVFFAGCTMPEKLLKPIRLASYSAIVINIMNVIWGGYTNWDSSGYMEFGYGTIVFWIIIMQKSFMENKPYDWLFLIASGSFILAYGNRSLVIIMLLMGVLFYLLYCSIKGKIIIFASSVAFFATAFIFAEEWIMLVMDILDIFEINSRSMLLVLNYSFISDSTREYLFQQSWDMILKKPLLGWGIGADRIILGEYTHNFILEIWICFGLILGSMLLIGIFYIGYFMISRRRALEDWFTLFFPFYGTGICILFFSKSIFTMLEFNVSIAIYTAALFSYKLKYPGASQ